MKNNKSVYVLRPEIKCWYGVKVDKNTELEFKNDFVEQKIEKLKLKSIVVYKNEEFESKTELTVNLKEGDILLLEEENRGYYLPKDTKIGTIDEAFEDLEFLKKEISKIKE